MFVRKRLRLCVEREMYWWRFILILTPFPLQVSEFNLYDACFEGTSAKEPVWILSMPQDIDELKYRNRGGCATAAVSMLRNVSFERPRILALKIFKHKENI